MMMMMLLRMRTVVIDVGAAGWNAVRPAAAIILILVIFDIVC